MSVGRSGDPQRQSRGLSITPTDRRAQSHVVGVVLLLGLTTVALGGLTAAVGGIVDDQTSHADATRVVSDFDDAIRPVETTGPRRGQVSFSEGTLSVDQRDLRVLDADGVVAEIETNALVFESEQRRVAAVSGAIVRGRPGNAWIERKPPVTAGTGVLVVGAPRLGDARSVGGEGGLTVPLRTNVSHSRTDLGAGPFRVAIETATPEAFERYAADLNATTSVADLDGDGTPSVVIDFEGSRTAYLVVHELGLEVGNAR